MFESTKSSVASSHGRPMSRCGAEVTPGDPGCASFANPCRSNSRGHIAGPDSARRFGNLPLCDLHVSSAPVVNFVARPALTGRPRRNETILRVQATSRPCIGYIRSVSITSAEMLANLRLQSDDSRSFCGSYVRGTVTKSAANMARVGGFAVALGIGTAVATGQGVALADPSDTGTSPSADSQTSSPAGEASSGSAADASPSTGSSTTGSKSPSSTGWRRGSCPVGRCAHVSELHRPLRCEWGGRGFHPDRCPGCTGWRAAEKCARRTDRSRHAGDEAAEGHQGSHGHPRQAGAHPEDPGGDICGRRGRPVRGGELCSSHSATQGRAHVDGRRTRPANRTGVRPR